MKEFVEHAAEYLAAWNEKDWEVRIGGEVLLGVDCTTVDDQNRFLRIDGFFGTLE